MCVFTLKTNLQLTSGNPLHSSSIALGNPTLSLANNSANLSTSNIALEPVIQMASNAHSPKSPNQLVSVQQQQQPQSQHSHNSTQPISASSGTSTSFRLNLDSSEQVPSMHQNGGSTTGVGAAAAAAAAVTSLHQATPAHVPSAMSTSLHSGSGSTAAGFDPPTTTWNSTSSLSPTNLTSSASAQHHRKLEVKLNAMP